jgi:anti-sigma B factor antagonist
MVMTLEKIPSLDSISADSDTAFALSDVAPLQVFVSQKDERTQMILMGQLDLATAPLLAQEFLKVAQSDADVVLDIGLLTFIDSTGLSLFVSQHKKLQAEGHELVIYSPTPRARRLFEITGLTDVFTIDPAQ